MIFFKYTVYIIKIVEYLYRAVKEKEREKDRQTQTHSVRERERERKRNISSLKAAFREGGI